MSEKLLRLHRKKKKKIKHIVSLLQQIVVTTVLSQVIPNLKNISFFFKTLTFSNVTAFHIIHYMHHLQKLFTSSTKPQDHPHMDKKGITEQFILIMQNKTGQVQLSNICQDSVNCRIHSS